MKSDQAFFDFGTQYYVAGRYAVFAHLTPVAANLLHHAIEMYLKGCLVGTLTLDQMKKKCGHDLLKTWQHFKSKTGDPTLDQFDGAVSNLNNYETIRYPNPIITKGMICVIGFGATASSVASERPEPQYHLDVEAIDSLARVLFKHASFNPTTFAMSLASTGREYLFKMNIAFQDLARP